MTSALDLLRELVEIESPTYSEGVGEVAARVGRELKACGADVQMLDGGHLRAELAGDGPPLLLIGHTDTVWPVGTLATMPFRVEGTRALGPGVYDMKACLVVLVEALSSADRRRAVRVFLTADEEMGSRDGRIHLEEAARGAGAAFVVEPPNEDGDLKIARKGLGRFRVIVTGRSAHPADVRDRGVSAIEELAHQILALHALNDPERGISVSVGVVSGGTSENVIPARAEAHVDVRVARTEDRERMERALASLEPHLDGAGIELGGGWTRPPLEPTPESRRLFDKAREHGRALGLDLKAASSGGGSDGNLVGAVGVPVLDGLGAEGGGAHAPDEHVLLDSIPLRAALLARLLEEPGI